MLVFWLSVDHQLVRLASIKSVIVIRKTIHPLVNNHKVQSTQMQMVQRVQHAYGRCLTLSLFSLGRWF